MKNNQLTPEDIDKMNDESESVSRNSVPAVVDEVEVQASSKDEHQETRKSINEVNGSDKDETTLILEPLDVQKLVERFKSLITLSHYNENMIEKEHQASIEEFVTAKTARKLLIFIENVADDHVLRIQKAMPKKLPAQAMYFIRESTKDNDTLTEMNFSQRVQYVSQSF